jgi:hypothetical protein
MAWSFLATRQLRVPHPRRVAVGVFDKIASRFWFASRPSLLRTRRTGVVVQIGAPGVDTLTAEGGLADVHLPSTQLRPIAAADVAAVVAETAQGEPVNGLRLKAGARPTVWTGSPRSLGRRGRTAVPSSPTRAPACSRASRTAS